MSLNRREFLGLLFGSLFFGRDYAKKLGASQRNPNTHSNNSDSPRNHTENREIEPQSKPHLFLTFDDGPTTEWNSIEKGPTPELLSILKTHDIQATFFVVGMSINNWEGEILAQMIRDGHTIGIHSYDHQTSVNSPTTGSLPPLELAKQFLSTHKRITEILNDFPEEQAQWLAQPVMYRRPGGYNGLNTFLTPEFLTSARDRKQLSEEQYQLLSQTYEYSGWHVSCGDSSKEFSSRVPLPRDLNRPTPEEVAQLASSMESFLIEGKIGDQDAVLNLGGIANFHESEEGEDGVIILAHDNFAAFVRAWDIILPTLKASGYVFETLPRPSDKDQQRTNSYIVGIGNQPTHKQ